MQHHLEVAAGQGRGSIAYAVARADDLDLAMALQAAGAPLLARVPERWDGKTGERIAALYEGWLSSAAERRAAQLQEPAEQVFRPPQA